jgi:hypothetical protein
MEPLNNLVTFLYDLTLGGGAFYIGASLTLYLTKRWQELEPRPKAAVQIPLALKEQQTEELELELPAPQQELILPLPDYEPLEIEPAVQPTVQPTVQLPEPLEQQPKELE